MAQTGYSVLSLYYSSTATNVPTAGNLVAGELAINTADGKLFYKDNAGVVQVIAGKGGAGVAGGSNTQVQYNSSGSLAGSANMTFNGTTLTLANDASISGLTVGKGGGALQNAVVGGYGAFGVNSSGANNAVFGNYAMISNTSGGSNSAFGGGALYSNTTGNFNTSVGNGSLQNNTTASNNTAVGYQSLYANTTGTGNTGLGYFSLKSITTSSRNTAIGYGAGTSTTSGHVTAIGYNVLTYNTTGTGNTGVGGNDEAIEAALQNNTTGSYNIAVGTGALVTNSTGSNNTAQGYQALAANTTASSSVAVGYQAGYSATTNGLNTFVGAVAGYNATGANNTFVGNSSGTNVTSGAKNTILGCYNGTQGGLNIQTASNYIVLSDGDGNPRLISDGSGNVTIGNSSQVGNASQFYSYAVSSQSAITGNAINTSQNNDVCLMRATRNTTNGTFRAYSYYNDGAGAYKFYVIDSGAIYSTSTSITSLSDQRFKENIKDIDVGLDAVMALKPRRFDWIDGKGENRKNVVGFIAQEIQQILPDIVSTYEQSPEDKTEYLAIRQSDLIPTLVKAIQEQQAIIEQLKAKVGL
jgi:hypothetical protein